MPVTRSQYTQPEMQGQEEQKTDFASMRVRETMPSTGRHGSNGDESMAVSKDLKPATVVAVQRRLSIDG